MQCFYCGRDIPEGAMFCECGHPVKQYASDMAGGSYGAVALPKQKKSVLPTVIGIIIALALVAGFIYFQQKNNDAHKVTDKDQWETVDKATYSMTMPKDLKKGTVVSIGDAKGLDFLYNDEIAICTGVETYTDGDPGLTADLLEAYFKGRTRSVNGVELTPKRRGDINYYDYDKTSKNTIGKTDELHVIESYIIGKKGIYEVDVYCARSDFSDYQDYMFEWIESFKEK